MAELIGTTIGNYRIESLLGTGGMGQVYLGVHLHLNRPAAIKVMHGHLAGEDSFKRRFRQEARAVAALSHPHIVQTWDFGTQDGNFYLVMELLTDGSLRSLLNSDEARQPGWPIHVGIDLVRQAAEGLAYAHHRGMVHRDVKPDNLLLQRQAVDFGDGASHDLSVKITDFGLARMTEEASATGPSLVMGTPAFMSPELCQGLPLDGRSDIYSLGVVLYQVVTGRLPFETRAAAEAVYKHVYAEPPRPSEHWPEIPATLEAIILRCLMKNPDDRFATAAELARSLRNAHAELVELTPPPIPADRVHHERTPSPVPLVRPLPTPRSAAVAHVVITSGSGGTRQVAELGVDGLIVGSLPDNDVVLGDEGVFGRHLRIDWDGEQATATDLGSRSGTILDGVLLEPHVSRSWGSEDQVRIGSRTLQLLLPTVAPAAVAERTSVTPVPVAARASGGDADATMVIGRSRPSSSAGRWHLRSMPMLAAAAAIALFLSVGGYQALSSDGDNGGRVKSASLANVSVGDSTGTVVLAAVDEPTKTPEATATATSEATGTSEATRAATRTATATRTPTPRPTDTPAPTATEPPPPPAPTNTPIPPTATVPPATVTPSPPSETATPAATAPVEPTPSQAPEPTIAPTEEQTEAPTTPEAEPTPETGATPDAVPGSVPRPTETPGG